MEPIDRRALARELVRAIRGGRSRQAFARRIGVSANAVYAWESGVREPPAAILFVAAERTGIDVIASLRRLLGAEAFEGLSAEDPALPGRVVRALKGTRKGSELAQRAGVDRSALSRWISGSASPRLADLLAVVDAAGSRTVDFVSLFAEPDALPSLGASWGRLKAARRLAAEHPWALALLVAFDLDAIRDAPTHPPGFIGAFVGLGLEDEQGCLSLLAEAGLVHREGERWEQHPYPPVALLAPEAQRTARAWAARTAAERIRAAAEGTFGFIVFAASQADHDRLLALHKAYAEAVKSIALNPTGNDRVYVANAHLFPLGKAP